MDNHAYAEHILFNYTFLVEAFVGFLLVFRRPHLYRPFSRGSFSQAPLLELVVPQGRGLNEAHYWILWYWYLENVTLCLMSNHFLQCIHVNHLNFTCRNDDEKFLLGQQLDHWCFEPPSSTLCHLFSPMDSSSHDEGKA